MNNYNIFFENKIRVFFNELDKNLVKETIDNFLFSQNKLLEYFKVDIDFPVFNIFLIPSRDEYDLFVKNFTQTPTSKERIAQTQGNELYLLSPNVYHLYADCYSFNKEEYTRLITHEFTHIFEELISPKSAMECKPTWWHEGLAVYLSEQYNKETEFTEGLKDELKIDIPKLKDLSGFRAYIWGWTVINFIESRYGANKILELIKDYTYLDFINTFGLSEDNFENEWQNYLSKGLV